ncbi:unnamed protein product [Owenia fusiformis]|uniref:Uncharacterized protein n=1 Tax=Owenia fusiformis TaxID=6347 RepID=A0A8J1XFV9_OWEFU|nr:unnamed protein product [Owenia fusiformis]
MMNFSIARHLWRRSTLQNRRGMIKDSFESATQLRFLGGASPGDVDSSTAENGVLSPEQNRLEHAEFESAKKTIQTMLGENRLLDTADYDSDMPVRNMANPYAKPHRKCILCEHTVQLDYKNTQLLSQFLSSYTGNLYGRHITGLCIPMQRRVSSLVNRARFFGLMPYVHKDVDFLEDPTLYNPFRPKRQPSDVDTY